MSKVFLGLGSNLGDSEATILQAYKEIERLIGTIKCKSAFYRSEPWGYHSDNQFVNSVILVETRLRPFAVLACTQYIEHRLGKRRKHATERLNSIGANASERLNSGIPTLGSVGSYKVTIYHDRPIDIDILLFDDLRLDTPRLTIPHPLMWQRPFVMEPLKSLNTNMFNV